MTWKTVSLSECGETNLSERLPAPFAAIAPSSRKNRKWKRSSSNAISLSGVDKGFVRVDSLYLWWQHFVVDLHFDRGSLHERLQDLWDWIWIEYLKRSDHETNSRDENGASGIQSGFIEQCESWELSHALWFHLTHVFQDIALIKLPLPVPLGLSIKAIELPQKAQALSSFIDYLGIVSGFGRTSDNSTVVSPTLNYVSMRVISNLECSNVFGSKIVTNNVICARGSDGTNRNACLGGKCGQFSCIVNLTISSLFPRFRRTFSHRRRQRCLYTDRHRFLRQQSRLHLRWSIWLHTRRTLRRLDIANHTHPNKNLKSDKSLCDKTDRKSVVKSVEQSINMWAKKTSCCFMFLFIYLSTT